MSMNCEVSIVLYQIVPAVDEDNLINIVNVDQDENQYQYDIESNSTESDDSYFDQVIRESDFYVENEILF